MEKDKGPGVGEDNQAAKRARQGGRIEKDKGPGMEKDNQPTDRLSRGEEHKTRQLTGQAGSRV